MGGLCGSVFLWYCKSSKLERRPDGMLLRSLATGADTGWRERSTRGMAG